ncbi:hypothetical protein B7P43_G04932, partial [Cryptotermes secundus]
YLGNMINNGNRNDNYVKERTQAGNRAYFTNLSMLKSIIISRAAKLRAYKTLRNFATYRAETLILTVREENALRIFIKSQRIKWMGHVKRMEDNAMPKRMLEGRLYSKTRKGRPRIRWLDNVKNDLKKMRNREQWRLIVKEAKVHPGL